MDTKVESASGVEKMPQKPGSGLGLFGASDKVKNEYLSPKNDLKLLLKDVYFRSQVPVAEILVHFIVTVASIISIYIIELLLHVCGLAEKSIPYTEIKLESWMFILEVVASTLIITIGIGKATIALIRS